jgi:PAB-dependent poly(A)-specific ribonuclease subunit 3
MESHDIIAVTHRHHTGFRLSNEHAIRSVKDWRRIKNASVVTIHDAFTTRSFGDSSIVFVQDYHPTAKSLSEVYINPSAASGNRYQAKAQIQENVLWSFISQIASALKAIHSNNLAARCIDVSKILLTDKNRICLNSCSILDVLQFDHHRPIHELQQEDFVLFGKAIVSLATATPPALLNSHKAMEQISRNFSQELRDTVVWLLTPQQQPSPNRIDDFIRGISTHIVGTMDMAMHAADTLHAELYRELENGRLFRLMAKLGTINERQEYDGDRAWSENGERYMLKLFRDYVFHQVDANGQPVLDFGHMVRCLNKLDAGSEERICLTSRDEQTSFVVSYKEIKKQVASAFGELSKHNKHGRGFQS